MSAAPASVAKCVGRLATEALIAEADLSPKPGLVTPLTSGAHPDMDHRLFMVSARALEPCFEACAAAGEAAAAAESTPGTLLSTLRVIGQEGELAMFRATGGINTHKGAIFSLGLLAAAVAFVRKRGTGRDRLGDAACAIVADLCAGMVGRELAGKQVSERLTAGERLFRDHGVRGARGQAEDGYPLIQYRILPLLRRACLQGREAFDRACLDALLLSMSELEDSCLLARGGPSGLAFAWRGAQQVLLLGGAASEQGLRALHELDGALIEAGLSPGGSADMLAAGIFLVTTEHVLGEASICHPQDKRCRRIA